MGLIATITYGLDCKKTESLCCYPPGASPTGSVTMYLLYTTLVLSGCQYAKGPVLPQSGTEHAKID